MVHFIFPNPAAGCLLASGRQEPARRLAALGQPPFNGTLASTITRRRHARSSHRSGLHAPFCEGQVVSVSGAEPSLCLDPTQSLGLRTPQRLREQRPDRLLGQVLPCVDRATVWGRTRRDAGRS
jgi:hypothetical protein